MGDEVTRCAGNHKGGEAGDMPYEQGHVTHYLASFPFVEQKRG